MGSDRKEASRVPPRSRPPSDRAAPPLRDDDVVEDESLRGVVVRVGVGALPAVWED